MLMNRFDAASPPRCRSACRSRVLMLLLVLSAPAIEAGPEPTHGWGLVDWGMTEAQVESAYGDGVEKLPPARNRHSDMIESLRLKSPLIIDGVNLVPSFAFSRIHKGLESVILRANLSGAATPKCQDAYLRIRQTEVDQMATPIEEKPVLRSRHAIWHGISADAQLSELEATGRCFVTLVYKRPGLATAPSERTQDAPADQPTTPR